MEQTISTILLKIQQLQQTHSHLLVAIDGRCGAGKTTLAGEISNALGCPVIHLDHFFLQPCQRTPERLHEPGNNFDRERFLEEVIPFLQHNKPFSYHPFDCKTQSFAAPVRIPASDVVLIEGSYCCHPELFAHYDLTVFLDISPEKQMQRIQQRNGCEMAEVFKNRWIPLEEQYFSSFSIPEKCSLYFSSYPQTKEI